MNGKRVKRLRRTLRSQMPFDPRLPAAVNTIRFERAFKALKRAASRGRPRSAPRRAAERQREPRMPLRVPHHGRQVLHCQLVGRDPRRLWREGEPVHDLRPLYHLRQKELET